MNIFAITTQEILDRISRHCPEALYAYLHCLNRATKDGAFILTKQHVEVDMSENWRPFLNNIKKLARENLLHWHPMDEGIAITLADIEDEEEYIDE